jgi:hypothetical protein
MADGAILSRASLRSCSTPSSYSIVVSAPVDPGQKRVTRPLVMVDCFTIEITLDVISIMSLNPFVSSEIAFVKTIDIPHGFLFETGSFL